MKTIASLAALAAAFLVAPVAAGAAPRSMVVRAGDLDLSSPRGLAVFERRVHRAATEVCGKPADYDVVGRNDARRCVAQAKAAAQPSIAAMIAASRRGAELAANQ